METTKKYRIRILENTGVTGRGTLRKGFVYEGTDDPVLISLAEEGKLACFWDAKGNVVDKDGNPLATRPDGSPLMPEEPAPEPETEADTTGDEPEPEKVEEPTEEAPAEEPAPEPETEEKPRSSSRRGRGKK